MLSKSLSLLLGSSLVPDMLWLCLNVCLVFSLLHWSSEKAIADGLERLTLFAKTKRLQLAIRLPFTTAQADSYRSN